MVFTFSDIASKYIARLGMSVLISFNICSIGLHTPVEKGYVKQALY